jgi:hypothetical protein
MKPVSSEAFTQMAARIQAADPDEFGGAFVMVTPSGQVLSFMITDPGKDEPAFVAMTKTKVEVLAAQIDQAMRGGNTYGRR